MTVRSPTYYSAQISAALNGSSAVSFADRDAILSEPLSSAEAAAARTVLASIGPPTPAQIKREHDDGLVLRAKLEYAVDSNDANAATTITNLLERGFAPGLTYAVAGMSCERLSAIVARLASDRRSISYLAETLPVADLVEGRIERRGLSHEAKASLVASLDDNREKQAVRELLQ